MIDARGIHDARRVVETVAVQGRSGLVQRLVVERFGEDLLVEVAADDRHLVDRGDRRDAQTSQRRDQAAARGVLQRQVVDRRGEHVRHLLRDQLLRRGHPDVDRLRERDVRAGDQQHEADHGHEAGGNRHDDRIGRGMEVHVAGRLERDAASLVRQRVLALGFFFALDRRREPVAVAFRLQVAIEL